MLLQTTMTALLTSLQTTLRMMTLLQVLLPRTMTAAATAIATATAAVQKVVPDPQVINADMMAMAKSIPPASVEYQGVGEEHDKEEEGDGDQPATLAMKRAAPSGLSSQKNIEKGKKTKTAQKKAPPAKTTDENAQTSSQNSIEEGKKAKTAKAASKTAAAYESNERAC